MTETDLQHDLLSLDREERRTQNCHARAELATRPKKGPVKLSYAEADWLLRLLDSSSRRVVQAVELHADEREQLRFLVDRETRRRLQRSARSEAAA